MEEVTLSLLCVSRVDDCSLPFLSHLQDVAYELGAQFVLAADGSEAYRRASMESVLVHSKGYFESALDQALVACDGDYVLRLDDDERVSPAMMEWLKSGIWQSHDHWEFPRVHRWQDGIILTPQLFPDYQTRLSVKAKSGGHHGVHSGSPFGGKEQASVCIEHHKFIVKDYRERRRIAAAYDAYHQGYGTGDMLPFSLPEDAYQGQKVKIVSRCDGWVPLTSAWEREEQW